MDALHLLSRLIQGRSLKEAFEASYRGKALESFSLGPGGLPALLAQDEALFSLTVDLELSDAVVDAVNREFAEAKAGPARFGNGSATDPPNFIHHRNLQDQLEISIVPRTGALHVKQ